jgi:2-keto-4-pentenoate hydratase/2-oxohepta-3-ene-1,7-dioic acid hydratase in catechol pathway
MRFIVGNTEPGKPNAVFLVQGDHACNLSEVHPGIGPDLMRLITDPSLLARIRAEGMTTATVPSRAIRPALPVARPGKVICLGLNYVDHVKEGGYDIPTYPALFLRTLTSLIPAGAPMIRPACSERLDYEAELMVIIGRGGRHIAEDHALDHVFGYTIFNDGSIRDYQRKTHQWTPGKNFDATGAIGPVVVTPDDLPPGASGLRIQTRVGDEVLQDASTDEMMWPVARTIATLSEYTTLEPGDMIAMGTPPGVGHARTPPRWLRPGETVEVEIEGIGICANPVHNEILAQT